MPIAYHQPDSETAKRYQAAATHLIAFIDKVNDEGGADNSAVQPTTPPGVSACSTGAGAASASAEPAKDSGGGCGCH